MNIFYLSCLKIIYFLSNELLDITIADWFYSLAFVSTVASLINFLSHIRILERNQNISMELNSSIILLTFAAIRMSALLAQSQLLKHVVRT